MTEHSYRVTHDCGAIVSAGARACHECGEPVWPEEGDAE